MGEVVKAYLSHARGEGGKLTPLARSLVEVGKAHSVKLLNDSDDAEKDVSIEGFMARLDSASVVVYLLNQRFFKSIWCVSELVDFVSANDPDYHCKFIITEKWLENQEKIDVYLRTNFCDEQIAYWQEQARQENDPVHLEKCKRIISELPSVLVLLSKANLRFEEEVCQQTGLADVEKSEEFFRAIKSAVDRQKDAFSMPCEDAFYNAWLKALGNSIDCHALQGFEEKLAAEFEVETYSSAFALVKQAFPLVCLGERQLTDSQFRSVYTAVRRHIESVGRSEALVGAVVDLIGLLILGLIEREVTEKLAGSDRLHQKSVIAIEEEEECSAALLMARLQAQPNSKLGFKSGCSEWNWANGYGMCGKEGADVVEQHIQLLWDEEFRSKVGQKPVIKRLQNKLKRNFIDGRARYLLLGGRDSQISEPIARQLKRTFPYLIMIQTGASGNGAIRMLSANFEEYDIEDELEAFATLLSGA